MLSQNLEKIILLIAYWVIFHSFLSSADVFFKINCLKKIVVGPDLGTNCLPRLSADDTG